jgi:hypothetical protein
MSLAGLFNSRATRQLNEEMIEEVVFTIPPISREHNPRLIELVRRPTATPKLHLYGTCLGERTKSYLEYLLTLSRDEYLAHLFGPNVKKGGEIYNVHKLCKGIESATKKENCNWLTYAVGSGDNVNPIVDLDFFIYNEQLVCLRINFLWEILQEYDLDNNYLNEGKEINQFHRALVKEAKLFLPDCFQFHPDLCKHEGIINPYQWGAYAPIEALEDSFINYVRSLN